ncbi:MAG: amidase [Deltaproteobacteria bacterium]|nr:MAG: amidase [Deltaproteobacteria bacterium]
MGKFDDLAFLDGTAQAELVRKKEVKPIELVDAAIERIERLNPTLNAVITPMFEQARTAAQGKLPDGPFTGVPFLLKDIVAEYAGVRLAEGSAFPGDFVSERDSELVIRLKRTGLIILGKTNTPEFGLVPTTEPHRFGPTHNPWNTDRTPGGSSGGSAAAVSAGLVSLAHGNDGGGSIRIPASCCGLFGLKPTRGRNPLGPGFGEPLSSLVAEHALTRSVRDSATLLDATSGPDIGDPYWAPPPLRPFVQELGTDPGRIRIAFTTAAMIGAPIHEDCIKAVNEAAALCEDLGHEVEEVNLEIDGELMAQALFIAWSVGCAWIIDDWAHRLGREPTPEEFEPLTWALQEMGRKHSAPTYLNAVHNVQKITREFAHYFVKYGVLLTPTLGEPPVALGTFDSPPENPLHGLIRSATFACFTPICNITGQPAMSVPLSWNTEGLPIGTHFIGRLGDEGTLFRLAAQLERARPWADRQPPVSA